MVTRHQIEVANPQAVLDMVDAWKRSAKQMVDHAATYRDAVTLPGGRPWSGQTRDAAVAMAGRDYAAIEHMRQAIDAMGDAVANGINGPVIKNLNEARRLIAEAEANGFHVNDDLSVTDTKKSDDDAPDPKRTQARDQYEMAIRQAARQWWDADLAVAAQIDNDKKALAANFSAVGAAALNAQEGRDDGAGLADGDPLSPEEQQRLLAAGTLTPAQLDALARGEPVAMGAGRMAYLYQLSQSLNGKSTAEIKALLDGLSGDTREALKHGLAIISNKNALSGVANSQGVTEATRDSFIPAAGSLANLPKGIVQELTRQDRGIGDRYGPSGAVVQTSEKYYRGLAELHDISDIFRPARGGESYLNGSEAAKSMLAAASQYANADIDNRIRLTGYPHQNPPGGGISGVLGASGPGPNAPDPHVALADVVQVAGLDHVGMSELATNQDLIGFDAAGRGVRSNDYFLRGLLEETWGDQSAKVGTAFDWMGNDPHNPINARTADAVAHFVSDYKGDFNDLPGSATTFGSTNPGLAEALSVGLGPYVSALAGNSAAPEMFNMPEIHQFENQQQMANLFSVLDQNHNSGMIINDAAMQQQRFLDIAGIDSDNHHRELEISGRLEGAMHVGIDDAKAVDAQYHVQQVEQQYHERGAAVDAWAKGQGSLSGIAGLIPEVKVPAGLENALAPWMKPDGGPMPNTVNIAGDNFLHDYVESRGMGTNTVRENTAILEGLLQRNPALSCNPAIAPYVVHTDNGPMVNYDAIEGDQEAFVTGFNRAVNPDVFNKPAFDGAINNDGTQHTKW